MYILQHINAYIFYFVFKILLEVINMITREVNKKDCCPKCGVNKKVLTLILAYKEAIREIKFIESRIQIIKDTETNLKKEMDY